MSLAIADAPERERYEASIPRVNSVPLTCGSHEPFVRATGVARESMSARGAAGRADLR
jgi:hypothetical protein